MAVKSTIKIDQGKIRKLTRASIRALEQTAADLTEEIQNAQVIPRDVGDLQESMHIDGSDLEQGSCSIVFNTPYARRLYYHPEYQFSKTENPNARGKWLEPWSTGGEHANYVKKAFKTHFKREAGC